LKTILDLVTRSDFSGMFVRLMLLAMALILTFALTLSLTNVLGGNSYACQVAFAIVFCCSLASLLIGEFPRGDGFVILRLGSSIFLRSGLVLVSLMILSNQGVAGRALLDNGIIQYILAFYSVGLFIDVWLTCLRTAGSVVYAQESYSSQPEF
jgi:hypothetical protein